MQRCPQTLPRLADGTGGAVMIAMRDWASQYHDCATRHNGLVDAIQQPKDG